MSNALFLCQKIDCSYQPVDLSNGIPFDTESIHSEMTSFHSASNTNEDLAKLAAPEQTKLVLVTYDPSAFSSKENLAAPTDAGTEANEPSQENDASNLDTSNAVEFGKGLENISSQDSHDSCIGSSIAGDTSSGFRASTILCTPDTSSSSFTHSTDTSANSDYIATGCESSPSSSLSHRNTPPDFSANPILGSSNSKVLNLPGSKESGSDIATTTEIPLMSKGSPNSLGGKETKTFSKSKDYIHATNALFAMVDRTPSNSE